MQNKDTQKAGQLATTRAVNNASKPRKTTPEEDAVLEVIFQHTPEKRRHLLALMHLAAEHPLPQEERQGELMIALPLLPLLRKLPSRAEIEHIIEELETISLKIPASGGEGSEP